MGGLACLAGPVRLPPLAAGLESAGLDLGPGTHTVGAVLAWDLVHPTALCEGRPLPVERPSARSPWDLASTVRRRGGSGASGTEVNGEDRSWSPGGSSPSDRDLCFLPAFNRW